MAHAWSLDAFSEIWLKLKSCLVESSTATSHSYHESCSQQTETICLLRCKDILFRSSYRLPWPSIRAKARRSQKSASISPNLSSAMASYMLLFHAHQSSKISRLKYLTSKRNRGKSTTLQKYTPETSSLKNF